MGDNEKKDDYVYFTRAGNTHTPNFTRLLWTGDQNQNWGRHNGIKSGLVAMLSAGFTGFAYTHCDIGAYTNLKFWYNKYLHTDTRREIDLIIRWFELAAFTSFFRSHEGNVPD